MRMNMQAFIVSPNTIRNKVKDFKPATFGGLKKEDVLNYLSVIAEQQGVLIKLLKDNGIPLLVDDGYDEEEQFSQPIVAEDYLENCGSNNSNNDVRIMELESQLEALRNENELLRAEQTSQPAYENSTQDTITDFDAALGLSSSDDTLSDLKTQLEEKNNYIEKLELEFANLSSSVNTNTAINNDIIEEYEREIQELKNKLLEKDTDININEENSINDNSLINTVTRLEEELKNVSLEKESLANEVDELKAKLEVDSLISVDKSEEDIVNDNIEVLELELSSLSKKNLALENELEDTKAKLSRYTSFKDGDDIINLSEPQVLIDKHKELLSLQDKLNDEKNNILNMMEELKEKEALIESNKHLLSEDFVNSVSQKEIEVDRLRKQMDKMLVVAEETAENTIKEANEKVAEILADANAKATAILDEAKAEKDSLEAKANELLQEANEFKTNTESELDDFREKTRQEAEQIILDAQQKADEVIEQAEKDAIESTESAKKEVEKILNEANEKVAELDAIIQEKTEGVEKLDKDLRRVRKNGLLAIKKLYDQLDGILYEDDSI